MAVVAILAVSLGKARLQVNSFCRRNDPLRVDPKDLGWIAMSWDGKWHPVKAKLGSLNKVHLTDWIATENAMRKRFRNEAELDREMVREALADIRATVAAAAARLDIGPSRINDAAVQQARDSLFVGMPIGDQLAVDGLEPASPAVDILPHERTDQLLEKDPNPPVAFEPQINDHNADDEGGEEPEILCSRMHPISTSHKSRRRPARPPPSPNGLSGPSSSRIFSASCCCSMRNATASQA
ncbi:hypothetical protein [Roseovarius nanhaiticus]|uniref:hypothetical protein n=1 Tax=Roseovarius nanhaiticus TaxID=573024 RepID=UPI0024902601|nr:hypothetical protein [Roseovarius nanhaiticus]